uniref:NADH-ubiquinone oxidoreductase chain 6 n=1 Tax=Metrocoris tenuicornis TaxID=3095937 RepID=A0AB38Z6X9_9HEMI|nr:NADH dehydrogenase subunit 6 [Metrocoris tenuicornis]WPW47045.1 NADH dehydrogenase subunit 6 [Metrocoris tenuicornis]
MKFIYVMIVTISSTMIMMKHPLSMGFNLIIMTILLSMMMNIIMKYSWYSYILTLVMMGGMLVLFMYMASVASNEMMKFSMKTMFMMMFIMIMTTMIMKNELYLNMNMIIPTIENQQNLSMMKLFNMKTFMITIMLAMYLLITMIYVIYITNSFEGPMRMKN